MAEEAAQIGWVAMISRGLVSTALIQGKEHGRVLLVGESTGTVMGPGFALKAKHMVSRAANRSNLRHLRLQAWLHVFRVKVQPRTVVFAPAVLHALKSCVIMLPIGRWASTH